MAGPVTSIGGLVPRGRPAPLPAPAAPSLRLTPLVAPRSPEQRQASKLVTLLNDPTVPQWAKDAMSGKTKRRSIGAQIGGTFGGLIPGALHFAKDAAITAIGPVRQITDPLLGNRPWSDIWHPTNESIDRYYPLAHPLINSAEQTAGRIAQLSPWEVRSIGGKHVQTYGDVYRQGDIVNAVLSDVGNVALAGGAVAKGLGAGASAAEALGAEGTAAKLGTAADYASTVSRLGGRAANAPLEATTGVLKGGKSLWRQIGRAGKEEAFKVLPKEGTFGSRIALASTPEGQVVAQARKAALQEPSAAVAHMKKNLALDAGLLERDKALRPSLAEQEAGLARVSGVAQADRMLASQLGPEASLAAHVPYLEPGVRLTPEGQQLAHAYEAGTLPPEQMARIDRVTNAYKKQAAQVTADALAGKGRLNGPMDPAYLGDTPLNEQVTRRLTDNGMAAQDVAALQNMVDQGAKWSDLTPLAPELGDILLDPQVYPKPWREAMNVMGRGEQAGAVGLPRTPEAMLAAGMERPTWMPTTESRIGRPTAPQTVATSPGFPSGLRAVSSERHSQSYGTGPYSLATASEGLSRNISQTKFNEVIQNYVNHADVPTAGQILDGSSPGLTQQLWTDAQDYARSSDLGNMTPEQFKQVASEQYGKLMIEELRQRGYEVLPGNRAKPKIDDFNPSKAPIPELVGPDSVVLPAGLKERMVQHRTGKSSNVAIAALTKTNSFFKRNVLAFNLHWTAGDAISNTLMSWVSGGVDPLTLARSMRDVKGLDPAVFDQIFNRPDFTATGLRHQAVTALDPLGLDRPAARTAIGRGVRRAQEVGFKANRVVNAIQREGYVLEKLERELRAKGLDSTSAMGSNRARWEQPAVQKAIADTINSANKTFGVLDEMSPFEQRVMTQIFPFWSWTRHITTLAARTAVDNPARILWTLRLGAIGMNLSPQDMPDFMRGSIANPFGGGRINLNWANPLYDVGSGGLASPGAALRSTAPLIKLGTTVALNRDLGRDANVITHRPGTSPSRITSALYQATAATPFTRGALNLAPTVTVPGLGVGLGPVRRYGSGQAIIDKTTGQPASAGSRLRMAANMVNTPLATDYVSTQPQSPAKRRTTGLRRQGTKGRLKRVGLSGG